MHDVCPIAGLADQIPVGIGVKEIVLLTHKLKHREMEYPGAEITVSDMGVLLCSGGVAA